MTEISRLQKGSDYYASIGWKIHPCHGIVGGMCTCGGEHTDLKDRGKHPVLSGWNSAATDNAATVSGWWNTNPDYNIGVFCKPSGFFVIDIDPRSGGDESFDKLLELLEYSLPETVEAITGVYSIKGVAKRGRHLYFKYEGNERLIGNFKRQNLPGIDLKHDGYVMAPPSQHASGVAYEWASGRAPWEMDMAEPPENLMEVVKLGSSPTRGRTGNVSAAKWGEIFHGEVDVDGERFDLDGVIRDGIQEGERAIVLYAMACSLANTVDVTTEAGRMMVETTMIRFNAERVSPPMALEGPNSVTMHTQRAIQHIINNPKKNFAPHVDEWVVEATKKIEEGTFRNQVFERKHFDAKVNTSDPDDDDGWDIYTAPGTIGGTVNAAAISGMSYDKATRLDIMQLTKDQDSLTAPEGGSPEKRSLSDLGNGRRMIDAFGSVARYTPGIGWLNWGGNHWKQDMENLVIKEQAKKLPALIFSEAIHYDEDERKQVKKWAMNSRSSARISACVESAKSDPRIRVDVAQWDSNPYYLGVANGVVDLRTGELIHSEPNLNITKHTPVAFTPGITSERWENFIDYATGGDKQFQRWLQIACGYTMTGLSTLDVMFIVYGPPGSGKNTFVEAMIKALGTSDYSWPMESSVLAADDGLSDQSVQYYMAQLLGRRAVWVDELPEGERIKENAVKKLTGSSEITGRSPGEKPFNFKSQAKLWLTTNHRPMITDDAMWRRIRPIPWLHVPVVSDPSLKEYLFDPEGGLPAVLAWLIEGARMFLNSTEVDGLGWCDIVFQSAEMYRKSEDRIGTFFLEETDEVLGSSVRAKDIYNTYRYWSDERGEHPLAFSKFVRKLTDRSFPMEGVGSASMLLNRVAKVKTVSSTAASVAGSTFSEWGGYR
jgi:P4 family phage/plasmid primase-like protien